MLFDMIYFNSDLFIVEFFMAMTRSKEYCIKNLYWIREDDNVHLFPPSCWLSSETWSNSESFTSPLLLLSRGSEAGGLSTTVSAILFDGLLTDGVLALTFLTAVCATSPFFRCSVGGDLALVAIGGLQLLESSFTSCSRNNCSSVLCHKQNGGRQQTWLPLSCSLVCINSLLYTSIDWQS